MEPTSTLMPSGTSARVNITDPSVCPGAWTMPKSKPGDGEGLAVAQFPDVVGLGPRRFGPELRSIMAIIPLPMRASGSS